MEEESFLIKDNKHKFQKYRYLAALSICFGIILLLSSILIISLLKNDNKTEYAKLGDVLINRIDIKEDGSGVIEFYNTRKEKINVSGYYINLLPSIYEKSIFYITGILEDSSKLSVSLPAGYFQKENCTILFQDPSGREYLDIIAYDKLPSNYFRYPNGGEWFFEDENQQYIKKDSTPTQSKRTTRNFEIHIFDVGQGDSQLIVFPSGYSILIDNSESNWNSGLIASSISSKVQKILGHKNIDVGLISHLHLDHMGYEKYGGFWALIEKHGFTFGQLIDRDAGKWVDKNGDGICDPNTEIEWKYAGTFSGTASNWICYATNPKSKVYGVRRVASLCSNTQIRVGEEGAEVTIVSADGRGAFLPNGDPIAANHILDKIPPSENDYSLGLLIKYKDISYATFGDLDGEDAISSFGYSYNHVEKVVAPRVGEVDIYRANHHGSSHSSSKELLSILKPTVVLFSCGNGNSYGHPSTDTLTRVYETGSEMYLTTNCANDRNYRGATLNMGDIKISSSDGSTYVVSGNTKTKQYVAKKNKVKGVCKI